MFQNNVLSTATVDLPHALPRTGTIRSMGRLVTAIPLPRTWQEYLYWTAAMLVVAGLLVLQIWLSLRITQAQHTLRTLQTDYKMVEQENAELLWQISRYTSLERIKHEAVRAGYVPALQREYRWAPSAPNQEIQVVQQASTSERVEAFAPESAPTHSMVSPEFTTRIASGTSRDQQVWSGLEQWWELISQWTVEAANSLNGTLWQQWNVN